MSKANEKFDKGNDKANHSNNRRVRESMTNSMTTTSQVWGLLEENKEPRLMKSRERISAQPENLLKRKLQEECNKQFERHEVSYNYEHIKQLKAKLKGMKEQCNFLKISLELAEFDACKEKREIHDAHQNIEGSCGSPDETEQIAINTKLYTVKGNAVLYERNLIRKIYDAINTLLSIYQSSFSYCNTSQSSVHDHDIIINKVPSL